MSGSKTPGVKESPLQKQQAQIAGEQFQEYQNKWTPVQKYFLDRTNNVAPKREQALGMTDADVESKFADGSGNTAAALSARGVGAGSGRSVMGQGQVAADKANAKTTGLTAANDAVTRQYEEGLSDIVSNARGMQVKSDQSLDTLAQLSGQRATQDAQISAQNQMGTGQLIGTGAGVAAYAGLRGKGGY